jgi:hypothetical protein
VEAGIVEPEETTTALQRLRKHDPAATDTNATIEELLDAVSSIWSESNQIPNL